MPTFGFTGTTTLDRPASPTQTARRGINLVPLHDALWRVTRSDGEVLGYIERFVEPQGNRFRAKRLIPVRKQFRNIGEFWRFDDAVDCLRFG